MQSHPPPGEVTGNGQVLRLAIQLLIHDEGLKEKMLAWSDREFVRQKLGAFLVPTQKEMQETVDILAATTLGRKVGRPRKMVPNNWVPIPGPVMVRTGARQTV